MKAQQKVQEKQDTNTKKLSFLLCLQFVDRGPISRGIGGPSFSYLRGPISTGG